MNTLVTFANIDIAALTSIPMLTAEGYVSLIKSLLAVRPKKPSPAVKRAIERLQKALAEAQAALVMRLGDEVDAGLERAFDILVDRLWAALRRAYAYWELYELEGNDLLSDEEREELDIEQCRELAQAAEDLAERMFGSGGSQFLRRPYTQQSPAMASRLQLVDAMDLADTFVELVGPRMATYLKICQRRYELMVEDRASRDGSPTPNLRTLRLDLARTIHLYSVAVAGSLDELDPASPVIVDRALTPNVVARVRRTRGGSGDAEPEAIEEPIEDLDDEPIEDLDDEPIEDLDEELIDELDDADDEPVDNG